MDPNRRRKRHPPLLEDFEFSDDIKPQLDFDDLRRLGEEVEFSSDQEDFGETSESEARQAGYMNEENKKAPPRDRRDDEGHGTGAYTDLGRGRSGSVRKH